jgi:DNA mismatch endonuclease (patch repair protein)
MPDIVSASVRSRMMAGIRGRDTKPEIRLRKALFARGFRYRVHYKALPGRPDIVLPRYHSALFVHGCFWHGHECSLFRWPDTRADFWREKISGNCARDSRTRLALLDQGWRVATIHECALRGRTRLGIELVADQCAEWIRGTEMSLDIAGLESGEDKQ